MKDIKKCEVLLNGKCIEKAKINYDDIDEWWKNWKTNHKQYDEKDLKLKIELMRFKG